MSKNPKVRKSTSSPGPAKPTKKFKANMTTLDAYSSTRALNQTLMVTVKKNCMRPGISQTLKQPKLRWNY